MVPFKELKADPVLKAVGIHSDNYRFKYWEIEKDLETLKQQENWSEYYKLKRDIALKDFFFFCYFILNLPVNHPFLLARCNEITDGVHFTINLWGREHWKSVLLTTSYPLWALARNRNERICIFSHVKSIASSFVQTMMTTMEENKELHRCFPDVFWENPRTQARKWSERDGIYVKRDRNFNEASIEAGGLVKNMPTSKHYTLRIYDDIVTKDTVGSKTLNQKTIEAVRMSENLKARGGRKVMIGTRYHHKDPYATIMENKRWKRRVYPSEVEVMVQKLDDVTGEPIVPRDPEGNPVDIKQFTKVPDSEYMYRGKHGGTPVYYTEEELEERYEENGDYFYNSQYLQNPVSETTKLFRKDLMQYYGTLPYVNKCIICDPSSRRKDSDYTVFWVLGMNHLRQWFIVDCVRDILDLGQKWRVMRNLVDEHKIDTVYYQRYGLDEADVYYQEKMETEGFYFRIQELHETIPKHLRIKRLIPYFQQGKLWFPRMLPYRTISGEQRDLIQDFIDDELDKYPYPMHDDMLDALASLFDPNIDVVPPKKQFDTQPMVYQADPLDIRASKSKKRQSYMTR